MRITSDVYNLKLIYPAFLKAMMGAPICHMQGAISHEGVKND